MIRSSQSQRLFLCFARHSPGAKIQSACQPDGQQGSDVRLLVATYGCQPVKIRFFQPLSRLKPGHCTFLGTEERSG
jgi:hypothetical protein